MPFPLKALAVNSVLLLSMSYSMAATSSDLRFVDGEGRPVSNVVVAYDLPNSTHQADSEPKIMDQVNMQFVPHVLLIRQGESVVFPNSDNIRHHVYSFSKPKQFEIKLYEGVPESPVLFDQPGIVVLGCNIHDAMQAYIFVSPWNHVERTDESGALELPAEVQTVHVWHPRMKESAEPKKLEIDKQIIEGKYVILDLREQGAQKRFQSFRKRYDD